jgi:hypothetical protein
MIDLNGATLGITRDDGSDINVDIEPINVEVDGVLSSTGVYELNTRNEQGEVLPLGRLAFHLEDKFDWEYLDGNLSNDELEQVVSFIQEQSEVDFFSRPKKTDLQRLEAAIYSQFKIHFKEDVTNRSNILYDGKPVSPVSKELDLKEFFQDIITTYSTL